MIVADSRVPETKNNVLPFFAEDTNWRQSLFHVTNLERKNGNLVGKIETSWTPVEGSQISDHFSTCPNQLRQGKIQKKLLGPEPKSVQQQGKICHLSQGVFFGRS